MATKKVKKIARELSYTSTWADGTLTVNTVTPHYLASGNIVKFLFSGALTEQELPITYVDGDTFTVSLPVQQLVAASGTIHIPYYSTGQTGDQAKFSISKTIAVPSIVQFTTAGAGGGVLVLKVSNDDLGWVTVATITLAALEGVTDFVSIAPAWEYAKVSITSIGAGTSVVVSVVS